MVANYYGQKYKKFVQNKFFNAKNPTVFFAFVFEFLFIRKPVDKYWFILVIFIFKWFIFAKGMFNYPNVRTLGII